LIVSDFKDCGGNWVRYVREDGRNNYTVSGSKWSALLNRCNEGGSLQRDFPAYVGCINKFKDFNSFTEWHRLQKGYSIKNYELDKDLLEYGNKIYSEDKCLLLPKELNLFFGNHTRARGIYPQGLDMNYSNPGKYRAQIRVCGESYHIGYFLNIENAKAAYAEEKTKHARMLADRYEGIIDDRAIEALRTKIFKYVNLDCVFV
jgi:hypothetical protein